MQITQQIRDYAAQKGLDAEAAVTLGLNEKAEEFRQAGGKIYQPS
jgi:phosphomethylpyrimidine synthase